MDRFLRNVMRAVLVAMAVGFVVKFFMVQLILWTR